MFKDNLSLVEPVRVLDAVIPKPKSDRTIGRMYRMHKYWARKPWYVMAEYIQFYTKPGDTVLDMFAGSGVTGIEATVLGRSAHVVDVNPIASFITNVNASVSVSVPELRKVFHLLEKSVAQIIASYYALDTVCCRCHKPMVGQYYLRGRAFGKIYVKAICIDCGYTFPTVRLLKSTEQQRLLKIESQRILHWYPKTPLGDMLQNRVSSLGVKRVDQLFTKRNLAALSILFNAICQLPKGPMQDHFKLVFSNSLLHVSKLKSQKVRPMATNSYWIPDDWIEENVWIRFCERFNRLEDAKRVGNRRLNPSKRQKLHIHQQSAADLSFLSDESVDYVLTDPPYGESIQYGELSLVWRSWLKLEVSNEEEIVVNRKQGKDLGVYQEMLEKVFFQTFRVLKSQGYMTLCFHSNHIDTWLAILQACQKAGFAYVNTVPRRPIQPSFIQLWGEGSPKTDLYVTLRKPAHPLATPKTVLRVGEIDWMMLRARGSLERARAPITIQTLYDQALIELMPHIYASSNIKADQMTLKSFIKAF